METLIKTVPFIRANALNHREFVALLGQVENEYNKMIYHSNLRWLSRPVYFEVASEL
jgi:hypothetical protein